MEVEVRYYYNSNMYDDIIEYFTRIKASRGFLNIHNPDGSVPLFRNIPKENKVDLFIPIKSKKDLEDKSKILVPSYDFSSHRTSDINNFDELYKYYSNIYDSTKRRS